MTQDSRAAAEGTVAALGEFALIDRIVTEVAATQTDAVVVGPGDDAAVLHGEGDVVISTDLYVEGRHFRRDWSSAEDIGHRVVAAAIADVVAMGAVPTSIVLGLACPGELPVEWVERFARGVAHECAAAGAAVAGGDISRADVVFVSVSALGSLRGGAPVTRSGAHVGDVVAIRGTLGHAAAGLAILSRGFRSGKVYIDAHRRPAPPYADGVLAAAAGATSMCDISDGLVQDLGHIAHASHVQIDLDSRAFDVPSRMAEIASALGTDPMSWILGGGDDHALAATFASDRVPVGWHMIGTVNGPIDSAVAPVTVDGRPPSASGGWSHFEH